MKRPSFQFYPADWRKDSALQSCSVAARGLWIEMMCVMHECEPYGQLSINGHAMNVAQLARLVGESEKTIKALLNELESAGVFSRDEGGCMYSRRMVNDERLRNLRAASGRLGGNPDLLNPKTRTAKNLLNQKDKQKPTKVIEDDQATGNQSLKQKPTPSSSSSSSTSVNALKAPNGALRESARSTRLPADWVLPQSWSEWAQTEKPDWTPEQIQRVAEQFRDYWLAKAGADAGKVDWQATWRTWVRREASFGRTASTRGTGPPGFNHPAALAAENARAKAMLFGPKPEVIDV